MHEVVFNPVEPSKQEKNTETKQHTNTQPNTQIQSMTVVPRVFL